MTAQQCIAHKWLRKRPPLEKKKEPSIVKGIIIEPPKSQQQEELDVTKDNLRLFVERWSEHPNSPYLFDIATHEITPCISLNNCNGLERTSSQQSMGGCSPSPCGSINSSPDSVIETDEILYRNDDNSYPNNLHSLERRASDSSCFVNKKADISLRVNLAEEIKKLSDRLYMLSTMNTDLGSNSTDNATSHEVTNVTEKLKNGHVTTNSIKTNVSNSGPGKTNSYSSIVKNSVSTISSGDNGSTVIKKDTSTMKQSSDKCLNRNGINKSTSTKTVNSSSSQSQSLNMNGFKSSSTKQMTNSTSVEENDNGMFNNLPWSRKKFKITHASRDVPLSPVEKKKSMFGLEFNKRREKIDGFVNPKPNEESSNTTANGKVKHFYKKTDDSGNVKNNANNTKDLLLHLLDQWDETQATPSNYHQGRHKSISMEWSEAEKVASKSMNTINTFFRKQSSVSSGVKKKQDALASNGYK